MVIVARRIWLQKNIVVFGGKLTHLIQLVRSVKEVVEEFYDVEQRAKNIVKRTLDTLVPKRMFPPCGVIKINWDA